MKTTGFIARRYLFSRKHISLISTLTIISVIGVTIGTALLIVVLSVFNGFFDVIKGLLLENDPDIRIESAEASSFLYDAHIHKQLKGIPEIKAFASYTKGKALLVHKKNSDQVVEVMGINPGNYTKINNLSKSINSGSFDLSVKKQKPGMLVSEELTRKLNLHIGDRLVLLSADGMRKSLTQFALPGSYQFEVRGIYSRFQISGGPAVYIAERAAKHLFRMRNKVSGIDIRLHSTGEASRVKQSIEKGLGTKYSISTWYDLQKPLYDIMYLEKWSSYFILMIIVIVAVLNIVGSLTMIVIQKNRDVGVLLTLGLTPAQIKKVFIKQGLYIGLIGCIIGGGLGLLLSWMQQQYGMIKLSSAFIINAYPVSIHFVDISIILAGSLILCLLASWYPAHRASRVEPADAIRYD